MDDPRQPKHEWESFATAMLLLLAALILGLVLRQAHFDTVCKDAGGTVELAGGARCIPR